MQLEFNKKIKIAFVLSDFGIAGAEKSTLHIIQHLDRSRFTPIIICVNVGGPLNRMLDKINVQYYILNKGGMTNISGYIKMWKLLKTLKIDILHTQLFEAHIYGRIAGTFAGVPVILSTYRNSSYWLQSKALRDVIKKNIDIFTAKHFTDALIGVSEGVRNYYKSHSYKNVIFDVVYNSVNIDDAPVENKSDFSIYDEFSLSPSDRVIVAIGRLTKQKGYEYLFPAIKKVKRHLENIKLLVFGSDQSNGLYQNLVEEMDLGNSVIFCGVVENIYDILTQADIFVSASLWEGLPRGHIEACLCKCPVVSTDIPGSNEVITHNVNGLLVPTQNPDALAESMLYMLNNPILCKEFVKNGLMIVRDKFDIRRNTEKLEELYLSIIKKQSI